MKHSKLSLIDELKANLRGLVFEEVSDTEVNVYVPNKSKSCKVTYSLGLYSVTSTEYSSSYLDPYHASLEVIECLVTREMYNVFTESEISYVISKLVNGKVS